MAEVKGAEAFDIPSFDAPTKSGHFACEIVLPSDLPSSWGKPQAYVMSAVNNKFGDEAQFLHVACSSQNSILFITNDKGLCDQIHSFAGALVGRMARPTRVFRLRLTGTSLLNNDQIKLLLAKLGGEILNFRFTGPHATSDYGHTALVELKQSHDWVLSDTRLPFRFRGQDQGIRVEAMDQLKKPAESKSARASVLCRDFSRGDCQRGHGCRFSHGHRERDEQKQQQQGRRHVVIKAPRAGAHGSAGQGLAGAGGAAGERPQQPHRQQQEQQQQQQGEIIPPQAEAQNPDPAEGSAASAAPAEQPQQPHLHRQAKQQQAGNRANSASVCVSSGASCSASCSASSSASTSASTSASSRASSRASSSVGHSAGSRASSAEAWNSGAGKRRNYNRKRKLGQSPNHPEWQSSDDGVVTQVVHLDDDHSTGASNCSSAASSPVASRCTSRTSSPTPTKSEDLAEASSRR